MVPDIHPEDIDAVAMVLRSGMLVQGEKVAEFETNVSKYIGTKNAIAVSNGTSSLYLALIALGIGQGDEVIVPAFSFMATANAVELTGAKPVFVDISAETFNIDINLIEKAITRKTRAIMPVHEFGLACDINEIISIAEKHHLKVIEDAACALGAAENSQYTGTFGDIGSFSFHPRKAITSGEGGMLTTNDDRIAFKLRALRNHGIEINDGKSEFALAGYNFRMTDFQAALLLSQFARLNEIIDYKDKLAQVYFTELQDCNKLILPHVPQNKRHSWQSFHVVLHDDIDRDRLIIQLKGKGIGTNLGAQCMPFQKFFREKYKLNCSKLFPNAMKAYFKGLVLPLYGLLDENNIRYICNTIKD
ncbi:MAG: DegT/DnrJ/EryC1/StrS family aminotransferase [Bacteroidales bacterium]|nr:DegT/DnrJ/EryC1/StrS family aminotransferase [Bacteroidales bacterium]